MFDNFIGGRWRVPKKNRYLGMTHQRSDVGAFRVPRSSAEDVELALDAAHLARGAWSHLRPPTRSAAFNHIEDELTSRGLTLALAACWDLGEPDLCVERQAADKVLATLTAPLERLLAEFEDWPAHTGISVVVKLALAAETDVDAMCRRLVPLLLSGHVVVAALLYQDGRHLPVRLLALMGLMAACLPAGVLNLVCGTGMEIGVPLANSSRAVSPATVPSLSRPTPVPLNQIRAKH